jgi:hypothetical protein
MQQADANKRKTCSAGENRQVLTLARLPISNALNEDNVVCIATPLAGLRDSSNVRIDIPREMGLETDLGSMAAIAQCDFCANDQYWFQSPN